MLDRVFGESALHLNTKLAASAKEGSSINIEACFSQLTLDVIGKAVFNYNFDALDKDSTIIQSIYTALKETESRATDLLPFWKVPALGWFIPRQRRALAAVKQIRATTEELIARCKQMVDEEEQAAAERQEEYVNQEDPSILRFLIASRDEVSSQQLRDDLLGMLVAGHETTGSVLTWTIYLLAQAPERARKLQVCISQMQLVVSIHHKCGRASLAPRLRAWQSASQQQAGTCGASACGAEACMFCINTVKRCLQEEVDRVMGDSTKPTLEQYRELKYTLRCINESMRLYPHPPVLLRRALIDDELPGGYSVPRGQDVMVSVYNIHRSPEVWDDPDEFRPERFPVDQPPPTELNTEFRCAVYLVSNSVMYCLLCAARTNEAVFAFVSVCWVYGWMSVNGHG